MRMPHLLSAWALRLASLSLCACAAAPQAPAPPPGIAGRVGDASFLTGVWVESHGASRVEEYWTPAAGGQLLGAGRELQEGNLMFFEHMRIEERGASLVFVALPFGKNSTEFALKSCAARELLFENEAHDYPKRIHYRLESDGTLVARIEGDGGRAEEWRYARGN